MYSQCKVVKQNTVKHRDRIIQGGYRVHGEHIEDVNRSRPRLRQAGNFTTRWQVADNRWRPDDHKPVLLCCAVLFASRGPGRQWQQAGPR